MAYAQILPRGFHIGADQQWLAGTNHVLAECIPQFAGALRQNTIFSDFEFEAEFFSLLEGDVKVAGIKNLA
jgi:hypothetical protein